MLVFLSGGSGLLLLAAGFPAVLLAVWACTGRERFAPFRVRILICAALLYLSFVFFFLSFGLEEIEAVGSSARTAPGSGPRGWPCSPSTSCAGLSRGGLPGILNAGISGGFSPLPQWWPFPSGAWISSDTTFHQASCFSCSASFSERGVPRVLSLTGGWVLFSWAVFSRMLNLNLPSGLFF